MGITIEVSLDWEKFKSKPDPNKQYKDMVDRRGNPIMVPTILGARVGQKVYKLTLQGFADAITSGQTWSPFVFRECPRAKKVKRRAELFIRCNNLALDFDNGITQEEILARCGEHGLKPNLIHESFSSSPALRKYRVVFVLDKTYDDSNEVRMQILTLMQWFPEADKAAKDLARLMYGTNKPITWFDDEHLNTINPPAELVERCEQKDLTYVPPDSEAANFKFSTLRDSLTDFAHLTHTQKEFIKKSLSIATEKIVNLNKNSEQSRYEAVFSTTERLTGIKGLHGCLIVKYMLEAISQNSHFKGWSYDPYEVIISAIRWKSQTPNIRSGRLFDIDQYSEENKNDEQDS